METLFTQKEAAHYLNISTTSITNWIRHGYLTSYQNQFQKNELEKLKDKIELGEINRLNKRANKSKSKGKFIPDEYISSGESVTKVQEIVTYINENHIKVDQAIFLLALNLFRKSGDINILALSEVFNFTKKNYKREGVYNHIYKWFHKISSGTVDYHNTKVVYLLDYDLPDELDILGIIYQSILHEGEKSNLGSYYTPRSVVQSLVKGNVERDSKVLDPCCGTGQFILAFSEYIKNPNNIYGFDIDEKAVDIAKINLLLFYKDIDFEPQIYCTNSLLAGNSNDLFDVNHKYHNTFDFIATNPPWGAKYDKKTLVEIKNNFKEINSKESFSFFICQSYRLLKKNGIMNFVLPESITNVKTHSDIREFILSKCSIQKIAILGKKFKNVFSSVITMQIKKGTDIKSSIEVVNKDNKYLIEQIRFSKNRHSLFDIYVDQVDNDIFIKISKAGYVSLANQSDWALGIVTGDNKKFITKGNGDGEKDIENIYKGSDIQPFSLKRTDNFIHFIPEHFQQVAPVEKYRTPEKLIYKFISSKLVFAYDDQKSLTLNSANILIPKIPGYPIKVVLGFLNSKLFNYYYQKKFNSIKILRGDIEQIPFPKLTDINKTYISNLVDELIENSREMDILDNYIFELFNLNSSEKDHIVSYFDSK